MSLSMPIEWEAFEDVFTTYSENIYEETHRKSSEKKTIASKKLTIVKTSPNRFPIIPSDGNKTLGEQKKSFGIY